MTPSKARQLAYICTQCAFEHGARPIPGHLATYHYGKCGACQVAQRVTEPRDFDWRGTPKC